MKHKEVFEQKLITGRTFLARQCLRGIGEARNNSNKGVYIFQRRTDLWKIQFA